MLVRPQAGINRFCNRGYRQPGREGRETEGTAETEVEEERVCRMSCRLQSLSRARVIFIISITSGPFRSTPVVQPKVGPTAAMTS